MRIFRPAAVLLLLLPLGCHSAFIEATIHNGSAQTLRLVELDYPSASFGTSELAPGQDFHYRFKLLGSGDLKLLYTDSARKDHTLTGPHFNEGDEGTLLVTISDSGTTWTPALKVH